MLRFFFDWVLTPLAIVAGLYMVRFYWRRLRAAHLNSDEGL
jgi:hypothetical protein